MRFVFRIVLVLLLSFQTAQASLSKGLAAAQAGDYASAYELWLPMADQGDAAAQFNLRIKTTLGIRTGSDSNARRLWGRYCPISNTINPTLKTIPFYF